jgi:GNAT superfamily N-acetyltransferase
MPEPSLADLHEQYVHALGRITALGPGGCAERVGPWLCIDAGLGVSRFNIAVVVGPVSNPRKALREAMEWFEMRAINPRLDLRGSVDGAVLAASVVEGFQFWFREAVMLLHPIPELPPPPDGLEVREVTAPADIDLYCGVDREEFSDQEFQHAMVERALAMDGVSLHLGLAGGKPVARSMAVTRGDLTGIHNVYVPPSERRKGYGAALTVAAIEAGRRAGATASCLEATVLGYPVYEAMGFRKVDDYVVVGKDSV